MSNDLTPSDAVEEARDRDDVVIRIHGPKSHYIDYSSVEEVLSGCWVRMWDDDDIGKITEEHRVLDSLSRTESELEVIDYEDSKFNEV